MERSEKGRGRPSSLDKEIVQALNVFRGLDPFKRTDDEKLKAIELICSKPGGLDAILNKKYKLKPMSTDEIQAFKDQQKVREYYAKHPTELEKHLPKFGFTDKDDFDDKHEIVDCHPHLPLSLIDSSPEEIEHAIDQAIDAAIENQHAVRAFSNFEAHVLYHAAVPPIDIASIASFHFTNQQEGSAGKNFAQQLRKRSIQLDKPSIIRDDKIETW